MNTWDIFFDEKTKFSMMDIIDDLKKRVEKLEEENVSLTNELYELHNRIDMIQNLKRTVEIPETAEGAYIEMIKKGYTMSGEGFWIPPNRSIQKVQLDGLTGDLYITIPDEFIERLNWKDDDELEWIDLGDGRIELRKV